MKNMRGYILATAIGLLVAIPEADAMRGPQMMGEAGAAMKEAMMLSDDGKYAEASEKLTQILRDNAQNADAWNLLGFASRMQGKFDAAEKEYTNALKLNPKHLGALNYMGQMFVQTGRLDQARGMLAKLKDACGDCKEFTQLDTAIREGKAGNY